MNLLAIPGSIRTGSYSVALLRAMSRLAEDGTTVTLYEGLADIPVFNPDTDDNKLPDAVSYLMTEIRNSDGIIVSTPEYAHGIPGALKNALDWLVSSDALVLKPIVVTSISTTSLGGARSHAPLVQVLSAMNSNVAVEGSLNVPFIQKKFDENYELIDEFTQNALRHSLLALERAIKNA